MYLYFYAGLLWETFKNCGRHNLMVVHNLAGGGQGKIVSLNQNGFAAGICSVCVLQQVTPVV